MNSAPSSAGAHDPLRHSPTTPTKRSSSWRDFIDNPWLMILMLFFVTAALGLPFLWISRGFSVVGKVLLTIAVVVWTALVLWVFYLIMAWCVPRIWESLQILFS
jgi:hypothetical protein